jgi:peptide deformylase
MAVREIVYLPDPVLRRKAHKVAVVDKDIKAQVEDMIETMRQAPGVGLAAPQIGISNRVVVVEYGDDEDDEAPKRLYVVVNPEIREPSAEMVDGTEACLSVPRLMGDVERHQSIVVRGLNRFGKPVKIKADGWLARIFQHEIDHLDGILYPDRASKVWQPTTEEEAAADV